MTLTLRPMTQAEFEPWYQALRARYEQLAEFARMTPEAAREKARKDHESLLGERGLETEGHSIYVVDDGGATVGDVWVNEQERGGRRFLWVHFVSIDAELRGRGYGKRAMALVEDEARRRGLPAVELNVFGGNEAARSLYRSLGYSEDAIWMSKDV